MVPRFATVSPENDILVTNDAVVRTNTTTATMVGLSLFTGIITEFATKS